ncbi:hypothetical protein GIB67_017227 [Kingdonia uniflora]|uniref:Uncharacterized protein n=1 Tax=Kingdonia uniflora TaxID=39325 RepID=A0A7J7NLA1_9MAGN|nr:hypothetical protein GIB67_017227 [Kingdonia uniflora]
MLKNVGSCNDGNVVLSKRYKTSDMVSGKDASVLESRMVHSRSNKRQPHERERINSSSFPNNRFITKNLESTQRERRKIRVINQELSEDDKWLKRAKGSGPRRWEYNSVVRGKLDSSADSHPDIEGRYSPVESAFKMGRSSIDEVSTSGRTNESDSRREGGLEQFPGFPGQLVSYPLGSDAFREFCKAKGAIGGKWGVKSTVERKKSLLDEVAEEETELKLVLGELGMSRKKRVKSRSKKVTKAQSTSLSQPNLTTSKIVRKFSKRQIQNSLPASGTTVSGEVTQGKKRRVKPLGASGEKVAEWQSASVDDIKEVARLVKGIWLGIDEQESELRKAKNGLEKNLARAKTDALKEVKQLKAVHAVAISQLKVTAKANLDETAEGHDRLGRYLMLKGYSQEEVDTIKAHTYAEEEEEKVEVLGLVDGLDGISPQTVLDNHGDDVKLPKGESEKVG